MQKTKKPITIRYKLFQDWKKGAFSEISVCVGLSMFCKYNEQYLAKIDSFVMKFIITITITIQF
ncbi:MAG: hypothetical protein V4683_13235 [Bacteroidota bacterium]